MAKTKGELATEALEDIGFDLPIDADDLSKAVRQLERMITGWANNSVYVSYTRTDPVLPTDDSGVNPNNEDAIISNLGVRLAQVFAVVVDPGYRGRAKKLYTKLLGTGSTSRASNPFMPLGAGNTRCGDAFFNPSFQAQDKVIGAAQFSTVRAEIVLNGGGTILDVEWIDESGTINITGQALSGVNASALLEFTEQGSYDVKIKATYSSGEVNISCLKYEVTDCVSVASNQAPEIASSGCSFIERTLALPGSSTAQDDVLTVTGTGILTLHNSATAVKEIKIIATDGTCTFAVEAGDSVNIANVTAGNSVELTPTEFGWLVS